MKIGPIIKALHTRQAKGVDLQYRLIHTGQHYDARMSGDFFLQLGIPQPAINLEVGSGTQSEQAAAIMVRYEKVLMESKSDLCLVVGDVTSTMACAIAAQKLCINVAHVEGGIRSGDWTMPEEINRMVTDSITNYFFTTSDIANRNLRSSGVPDERIFFVGNTMIDTLLSNMNRLREPTFWNSLRLRPGEYFVLTLHRPANVDADDALYHMLKAVCEGVRSCLVVFPVHPRTARTLKDIEDLPVNLCVVEPQPYLEFNYLVKHAKAVITDSGGITEEATVLGVPCLTLRDTTERPETITIGTNELVGTDPIKLKPHLDRLFAGKWKRGGIPERWDGRAGERIVAALEQIFHVRM
jgi:UDP-N-acetylglucosamine 2-epimerase (non-hydrolysing)